jgi:hypothetical protein
MKNFSFNSFIAGVIIGVLCVGGWLLGQNPELSFSLPNTTPDSVSSHASAAPESGAVSVMDQKAGTEVTVVSVTVPPPGVWLAVRETVGSDLANVLGAIRLGGPRSNVSIPLLRATEPDRSYAIELYRDDNNGEFDPGVNSVYVDFVTGARVVSYFNTTN